MTHLMVTRRNRTSSCINHFPRLSLLCFQMTQADIVLEVPSTVVDLHKTKNLLSGYLLDAITVIEIQIHIWIDGRTGKLRFQVMNNSSICNEECDAKLLKKSKEQFNHCD